MVNITSKILENVADLFKGSKRAGFFAAVVFLLIYLLKINLFDLDQLETYRLVGIPIIAYIGTIGIVCGIFYFDEVLPKCIKLTHSKYKSYRYSRDYLRNHLTDGQKQILTVLVHSPNHSHYVPKTAEMDELEERNVVKGSLIIQPGAISHDEYTPYRYIIQAGARKFLAKYPKLLETDLIFIGFKNGRPQFKHQ
jgi:hypothetical protein